MFRRISQHGFFDMYMIAAGIGFVAFIAEFGQFRHDFLPFHFGLVVFQAHRVAHNLKTVVQAAVLL